MELQSLKNVCNGGHLHGLLPGYGKSFGPDDVIKAMNGETKAILIVGKFQDSIRNLLRQIVKAPGRDGLWAAELCIYSNSANLWMVRTDGPVDLIATKVVVKKKKPARRRGDALRRRKSKSK